MFRGWQITIIGTASIWLAVNLSQLAAHNTSWTLLGGLFWGGVVPVVASLSIFWLLSPAYRKIWKRGPRLLNYFLFPVIVCLQLASNQGGALVGQLGLMSFWVVACVMLLMFTVLQATIYAAFVDWDEVEARQRMCNVAFLLFGMLPLAGVIFANHQARQPEQIVAVRVEHNAVEAVAIRYADLRDGTAMITGCSQGGAPAFAVATIQMPTDTHFLALLAPHGTEIEGMALVAHEGGMRWQCPSHRGWRSSKRLINRLLRIRNGGEVDVSVILPQDAVLNDDDHLRILVCSSRRTCNERLNAEAKI